MLLGYFVLYLLRPGQADFLNGYTMTTELYKIDIALCDSLQ